MSWETGVKSAFSDDSSASSTSTPTILLAIFYLSAFYLLTFVVDKIPIAIVYGTWSGLGIFTIAILGYIFFKQSLSWQAIIGMFFIVIGVTLVNIYSSKTI